LESANDGRHSGHKGTRLPVKEITRGAIEHRNRRRLRNNRTARSLAAKEVEPEPARPAVRAKTEAAATRSAEHAAALLELKVGSELPESVQAHHRRTAAVPARQTAAVNAKAEADSHAFVKLMVSPDGRRRYVRHLGVGRGNEKTAPRKASQQTSID